MTDTSSSYSSYDDSNVEYSSSVRSFDDDTSSSDDDTKTACCCICVTGIVMNIICLGVLFIIAFAFVIGFYRINDSAKLLPTEQYLTKNKKLSDHVIRGNILDSDDIHYYAFEMSPLFGDVNIREASYLVYGNITQGFNLFCEVNSLPDITFAYAFPSGSGYNKADSIVIDSRCSRAVLYCAVAKDTGSSDGFDEFESFAINAYTSYLFFEPSLTSIDAQVKKCTLDMIWVLILLGIVFIAMFVLQILTCCAIAKCDRRNEYE